MPHIGAIGFPTCDLSSNLILGGRNTTTARISETEGDRAAVTAPQVDEEEAGRAGQTKSNGTYLL